MRRFERLADTAKKHGRGTRPAAGILAAVAVLLCLPATGAGAAASHRGRLADHADYFLWTTHGLEKVALAAAPEKVADMEEVTAAGLRLARNERESFQVLVTPRGGRDLVIGDISLSDLRGPDGAVIPAAAAAVHEVGYINGEYPDVLFPAGRSAGTPAGENYNLWVTVYAPEDIPAGRYTGALSLAVNGHEAAVPVEVTAWDFTLPRGTRVETQLFTLHRGHLASLYPPAEHDLDQLRRRAFDLYVERRFSPSVPSPGPSPAFRNPLPRVTDDEERERVLACAGLGLNLPGSEALNPEELTVSLWVRPDYAYTTWYPLVVKHHPGEEGGGGFALTMQVHEAQRYRDQAARHLDWVVHTAAGETVRARVNGRPAMGRWLHLAATWDGETARLYIDGEEAAAATGGTGPPAANDLPLGLGIWSRHHDVDSQRGLNAFHGRFGRLRLYGRALDAAEIAAERAAETVPAGLVLEQGFDDFDDRLDNIRRYLPVDHLLSHEAEEEYFRWCAWWIEQGLFAGRLPFRGDDPEMAAAFFSVYVDRLRREGWLDRVWARLPGDEGYYHGSGRALANIGAGLTWKRLAPDLRTHMTFNGLYWRHTNEQYKLDTLRDFEGATDIYSINPISYLPFRSLRDFLPGPRVSWYIHHHMGIRQAGVYNRAFFWRMWQENVSQVTLWATNLWRRADTETTPAARGFDYRSRWFGNAVLFWPGEEGPLPSIRADIMRDGIEDWEYHRLLEEIFRRLVETHQRPGRRGVIPLNLYREVSRALDIPGNVVDSIRYATDDAALLLAQRATVADLILRLLALEEQLATAGGNGDS